MDTGQSHSFRKLAPAIWCVGLGLLFNALVFAWPHTYADTTAPGRCTTYDRNSGRAADAILQYQLRLLLFTAAQSEDRDAAEHHCRAVRENIFLGLDEPRAHRDLACRRTSGGASFLL